MAGDIDHRPVELAEDRVGQRHEHTIGQTLTLDTGSVQRELRAMGEARSDGTRLVVARTLSDVHNVRNELLRVLVGGGVVFLGTSLAAALLLNRQQRRRLSEIRERTANIANGDLAQRLPVDGRDELDMLSQLVNRMLDEIERLMAEVKGACDGIAHDLRTPLSRLRIKLVHIAEQLRENGNDEMSTAVYGARDDTQAILRRFAALLRISEIGAMRRRGGFEHVALSTLMEELYELYEPLAEQKGLQFDVNVVSVEPVWADRGLLFEAFSNLLDNAIKFAPQGGRVSVELRGASGGTPQFVVSDNGPGIPPRERGAVFSRFYRGEQTSHVPGSGLGLGIVSAIIRLHEFALRIEDAGEGTTIVVDCWPHNG
jgi:signal transduction histidine kinase